MAIDVDNLDIILRVIGLRTFKAQMAEARGAVAGVGKQAIASDEAMAASSRKTMTRMQMLRKVSLGVAGALAVTVGESVKMSMQYQREVEMIHTQAGKSQAEADSMYQNILNLSRKFPQGPMAMSKAMYHLESVGLTGKRAMDAMKASAELATVGNSDLESTTTAVGAAWRAGMIPGNNFQKIVAQLNAVVGAGNIRMQDLVNSFGTGALPVFRSAGLTVTDFGAALALMTDEAQHADMAATRLRMTTSLLAGPSKIAQKMLGTLGINKTDLGEMMQSGARGQYLALQVLHNKLMAKFPGADPHAKAERFNFLVRAFGGGRSSATLIAMMDQLDSLNQKFDQVQKGAKNWGDDVAKSMHLPVVRMHTAVSNIQVDLIHLGDHLRGPASGAMIVLLGAVDRLVRGLTLLTKHGKTLAAIFGPTIALWAAYKTAVLLAAGATRLAAGAVLLWNTVMEVYNVITLIAMDETLGWAAAWTILDVASGGLILALGLLATGIIMLILHFGAVKRGAVAAFHWIVHAASDAWGWIKHHWPLLLAIMTGPFGALAYVVIHNFKTIKHFIGNAADWIRDKWNSTLGKIHIHIPHWVPGIGGHSIKFPKLAAGGTMAHAGFATINEVQMGETVFLPGGTSVQPSQASSLAVPRAHTPNPAPRPVLAGVGHEVPLYNVIHVDGKALFKVFTKAAADDKARRGGP